MSCQRFGLVLALILTVLVPTATAGAASPTGSIAPESNTPTTDTTAGHPGWTLVSNPDPAFSVQLPAGWSSAVTSGPDLTASSATGEMLTLTVDAEPTAADFETYVANAEAELVKAAGKRVSMVLRQVGTGLVARIDQPSTDKTISTASFLFPACSDGVRRLTITGATPVASAPGRPDEWDQIAAATDPCATAAASVTEVDPMVQALADQYFQIAAKSNRDITRAYSPLTKETTLNVWTRQAKKIAALQRKFAADVDAMAWTPEVRPFADALLSEYAASIRLWGSGFAKAKKPKDVTSRYDDSDRAAAATTAAGQALRFAIGLPTNPR